MVRWEFSNDKVHRRIWKDVFENRICQKVHATESCVVQQVICNERVETHFQVGHIITRGTGCIGFSRKAMKDNLNEPNETDGQQSSSAVCTRVSRLCAIHAFCKYTTFQIHVQVFVPSLYKKSDLYFEEGCLQISIRSQLVLHVPVVLPDARVALQSAPNSCRISMHTLSCKEQRHLCFEAKLSYLQTCCIFVQLCLVQGFPLAVWCASPHKSPI